MSIEVGDILRIVASLVWADAEINQNVFNAVIGGSSGPYDEEDIIDDAVDWMETCYAELVAELSSDLDSSQVQVYVWDSVGADWDEVGWDTWTFNPTEITDPLPRGVAALLNSRSLDPDISGRKFIPGLVEGSIGSGVLNAPFVAATLLFGIEWATAFNGAVSTAPWVPGIWSPTNEEFQAMSGTLHMTDICAYQRRRKRGVGI